MTNKKAHETAKTPTITSKPETLVLGNTTPISCTFEFSPKGLGLFTIEMDVYVKPPKGKRILNGRLLKKILVIEAPQEG